MSPSLEQEHRHCTFVDLYPFGTTGSCMKKFLQQLSVLISDCQLYIPSLSTDLVSAPEKIEVVVNQCFSQLPDVRADEFFASAYSRIKRLFNLLNLIFQIFEIENKLAFCFIGHSDLPSSPTILATFHRFHRLEQVIFEMKSNTERYLFYVQDTYPDRTAMHLKLIMNLVRIVDLSLLIV